MPAMTAEERAYKDEEMFKAFKVFREKLDELEEELRAGKAPDTLGRLKQDNRRWKLEEELKASFSRLNMELAGFYYL